MKTAPKLFQREEKLALPTASFDPAPFAYGPNETRVDYLTGVSLENRYFGLDFKPRPQYIQEREQYGDTAGTPDCEHKREEVVGANATQVTFRCLDCPTEWREDR